VQDGPKLLQKEALPDEIVLFPKIVADLLDVLRRTIPILKKN
jgi:hypothetical protein